MLNLSRTKIQEDLLTLEDAALLADPSSQIPRATLDRLRDLVRSDPRIHSHYEFLETVAEQAEVPESSSRLHVGLRCLEDVERLAEAGDDWQHPAEVLDPTGEIGISYPELVQFAGILAEQEEGFRYQAIEGRLRRAWAKEKAGDDLVERFAAQLCEFPGADAERLLRQAARRYGVRRQAVEAGNPEKE